MRASQVIVSVSLVFICTVISRAAIPVGGVTGPGVDDGLITLIYDPQNGALSLDTAGKQLTSLEILSAGGNFKGHKPDQVNGLFDVFRADKFFILKPGLNSFGDQNFGAALTPGLTLGEVGADLTVNGSLYPQGGLGTVDLWCCPEPGSISLLGLGLLSLVRSRRRT